MWPYLSINSMCMAWSGPKLKPYTVRTIRAQWLLRIAFLLMSKINTTGFKFIFHRPACHQYIIANEFTNWSKRCSVSDHEMKKEKGNYTIFLIIPLARTFRLRFVVQLLHLHSPPSPPPSVLSLPRSETLSQQDVGWENTESASSAVPVTWEILQLWHFNVTSESELGATWASDLWGEKSWIDRGLPFWLPSKWFCCVVCSNVRNSTLR